MQLWQSFALLPIGLLVVYLVHVVGSLFDFFFHSEKNRYPLAITRLFMGFLGLTAFFSVVFFSLKTIFLPVLFLLAFLLVRNRSQVRICWQIPDWYFLTAAYLFLFLFRLSTVVDFGSQSFYQFFKDDYFYCNTLAALFYTRTENNLYELTNASLGLPSYYSVYHYFTFHLTVFLKLVTGFNAFILFNFFTTVFFQFFAFAGLFSVAVRYGCKSWMAFLFSLLILSTLRYSLLDEFLANTLHLGWLKDNMILTNYFSIQFLNTGFGPKFCIALGLVCLLFLHLRHIWVQANAFIVLFINPLMVFLAMSVLLPALLSGWKRVAQVVAGMAAYILILVAFLRLFSARKTAFSVDEVLQSLQASVSKSPVQVFFSYLGGTVNQHYNLLFFPLILVAVYRKKWVERLMALSILLYPICEGQLMGTIFYKLYLGFLLGSLAWVVVVNRKNLEFIYLIFSFFCVLAFSEFAHLLPEANQAFMFVMFTFPMVLALYTVVKLGQSHPWVCVAAGLLLGMNVLLNYQESRFRAIQLGGSGYQQKVSEWVANQHPKNLSLIGIYDSKMTLQFMNQFMKGEEISLANDRFVPTPVSIPVLGSKNPENSRPIRDLVAICVDTDRRTPTPDPTRAFIENHRIKAVVVNSYDEAEFSRYVPLFSQKVINSVEGYSLYLR